MPAQTLLLVATTNKKKLIELQDLLKDLDLKLLCLSDIPSYQVVLEDGRTFAENASKKAMGYARQSGYLTLAEDSGLCCDALDGAPGVYSARFSGEDATDDANNAKLLDRMRDIPDEKRQAHYASAVAIASPGQLIGVAEGEVHGKIWRCLEGNGGFGYDPLFYYPPYQSTFGSVTSEMKHAVSHRAVALKRAKEILRKHLVNGPVGPEGR